MDKGTALMAVFVVLGFLSTVVAPIAIFIVGGTARPQAQLPIKVTKSVKVKAPTGAVPAKRTKRRK